MKIIIDAMGGDNAPVEIVKGAALASLEYDCDIVLVGDESVISSILDKCECKRERITTKAADSVVTMEDEPTSVVRAKRDSSMAVGMKMLKEDGDAFVSAGNTGALHVAGSLLVRPVNGIKRAAIATVLPFNPPVLLMDSGANVTIEPEYLPTWGLVGSIYMKNVMGVENPRVGLLNNGTEEHKGTDVEVAAFHLLSEDKNINFVGNIEGKAAMASTCDVLLTDGFTGNVFLKTVEGISKYMLKMLKGVFTSSAKTKIGYLLVKDQLGGMKKSFDASEYGGAPLLGLQKPVIKAHGSSDALAIKNAVRQAIKFAETGVIKQVEEALGE